MHSGKDPTKVVKAYRNRAYILEDVEGRKLVKTWNNTNLKKKLPVTRSSSNCLLTIETKSFIDLKYFHSLRKMRHHAFTITLTKKHTHKANNNNNPKITRIGTIPSTLQSSSLDDSSKSSISKKKADNTMNLSN